jgi:beta-glucosidase
VVSLAAGLRAKLAAGSELKVVRGCEITGTAKITKRLDGTSVAEAAAAGEDDFAEAVSAAKAANVVILALGEPGGWTGENSSRSTLGLPGRQMELFDAVTATGKPVIVVLINGRPLAVPRVQEKAVAILEAWDPGIQGGNGVVDVLFGDVDPAGRLTTSFPRSVGQAPLYYNHFNTGRPALGKYEDGPSTPLYPFGFGLAYTTFEYGKVELNAPVLKPGGTLTAKVNLKNNGPRAGTEVVQLYIRDVAASAGPRPVRELKGFQKVLLQPGESRDVTFTLSRAELGYYDTKGNWLVEPGKFQLWLAKDSASGRPADFELVK